MNFQNHSLIDRDDENHNLSLTICEIHHQTSMLLHDSHHLVDHDQQQNQINQSNQTKHKIIFEPYPTYEKHELLLDFVHYIIKFGENANISSYSKESNIFYVCFPSCVKISYVSSVSLLIVLKGPLRSGYIWSDK